MDEQNTSEQHKLPSTPVMAISICFNIVNHALIGFVATYMTLITISAGLKPMSWHAWSCTIGYQFLMLEGILMFYSENVWSSQLNKPSKRCVHWIVQVIGSLLALSGILVKYADNNGKHFASTHSIIGLISGIFLLISLCSGVIALKSFALRTIVSPALVKFLHYTVGSMAILLGLIALCFGYDKKFMQANSDEKTRLCLQLIAGYTAVFSLIGALQKFYLRARSILWKN